ncbi:MAG: hypothetical protein WBH71_00860 [Bacteroidales bacterium]|jgi:hypothetical protein|nr:hypothetical protein [Bacteroidales bacterium]MDI9592643.1 hypothetical protein [Bacteroidota bacterium]OQC37078.1 MAG: hypothetical protein BWX63_01423 [Bacteroidetes bacterium ADurb.Bin041]MBP7873845.1 hypothetical protein [Bacteroidales bacterium]MCO6467836.1 hypothetical protein [Bacteroidales bacterium]
MRGKFSFLAHYLEIALKQARVMLPGVRRMDAFYHSSETEPLTALTSDFSAESEEPLTLVIDGKIETLEKLINLKSNYSWYSEDELPYCKNGDSNKIPDVFSELNKTVLMVRFTREKSTQKDALVVYFKENMIGFGMNLSQKEIKSDYKDIIAQMVINTVNTIRNISRPDRDIWLSIRGIMNENRLKMEQTTRKLENLKEQYQDRLVDSCNYFLSNISAKEGRKYLFSEGAIKLIKTTPVSYDRIENAIKLAVQLAINFDIENQDEIIYITENYLNFNAIRIEEEKTEMINTVYERPFNYLDFLESLAEKVKAKKLPIKSQTIIDEMEDPVSQAAITWNVNHNMKAMQHLFRLYPDKWPIIRNEFKPILRIASKGDNRYRQVQNG